jgi:hypothetical protein
VAKTEDPTASDERSGADDTPEESATAEPAVTVAAGPEDQWTAEFDAALGAGPLAVSMTSQAGQAVAADEVMAEIEEAAPERSEPEQAEPEQAEPEQAEPEQPEPEQPEPEAGGTEQPTAEPEAGETEQPGADRGAGVTEQPAAEAEAATTEQGPAKPQADSGERWEAFAPAPERVPTRKDRVLARVLAIVGHEWSLAALGSVGLAVVMTWPTLRYPLQTIPQDLGDPTLQAWELAWAGHAVTHDPAQLWQSNAFFPERYSFAFSDTLLGYVPAALLGTGPAAAILRYNIIYVLAFALAFFGAYALVRQLGAGRAGAAVAGAAYAYAPWRLAQAGHLHVISSGGIALALAMLARGHGWSLKDGYRPERARPGWALAGWLVAAWQIMIGFGIGLPFAYVLAGICLVAPLGWLIRRRPRLRGRVLLFDIGGGLVFAGVAALMAYPYLKVAHLYPEARRTTADVTYFSPPFTGFFIAPHESRIWGSAHEAARNSLRWQAEMTLLPGFALYGLAVAGLFVSIWTVWQRLALLAGVAVSIWLGMGANTVDHGHFGYMFLYGTLPGFDGLRTPGRLVVWTTLLLGVLAAGAVTAFSRRTWEISADRVPYRPGPLLRLATVLPLLFVLVEGLNQTPHPLVPATPAAMRTAAAPILVLPSDDGGDPLVMLWSTNRFPAMVNGTSGFTPHKQNDVRSLAEHFPDQDSIDQLRALGIKTVIVLRARAAGTRYEGAVDADIDGLDVTRRAVGDAVVYSLG